MSRRRRVLVSAAVLALLTVVGLVAVRLATSCHNITVQTVRQVKPGMSDPGKPRPSRFESPRRSGRQLILFRRVQ